jgi:hypothetical protein
MGSEKRETLLLYTTMNYHAPAKSAICNTMFELLSKGFA